MQSSFPSRETNKHFLIGRLLFAVLSTRGLGTKVPIYFLRSVQTNKHVYPIVFLSRSKNGTYIFFSLTIGEKKDADIRQSFLDRFAEFQRSANAYKIEWPSLMHGRFLSIEVDDLRSCRARDELSRQRGRILRSKNRCAEVDAVARNPLKIAKPRRCLFSLDTSSAQSLPGLANNRF